VTPLVGLATVPTLLVLKLAPLLLLMVEEA
jgi:hypothetical protein